jgi:uncharacterized protein
MLYIVYLLAIAAAEFVTVYVNPIGGALTHIAVLGFVLLNYALIKDEIIQKALVSLALGPLVRIVSLAMPLGGIPQTWWYPLIYAPLLGAAIVATRLEGLSRKEVALTFKFSLGQLLVALSGIGLGTVEYLILKPEPLIKELTLQSFWLPALIFFLAVGFVEEYIFRGVMQKSLVDVLGKWWGILFVSAVFALLHLGFYSWVDVVFVFGIALYFGLAVKKTGSLVGVTLSHGIANTVLYLIAPFILR